MARKLRADAPEEPWDKLPDESAVAFGAFREYLTMGPERSLAKVGQKLGKKKQQLERWSSGNRWVARAEAFDMAVAKRQDEAMIDELEQRGRRVAELATEAIEALVAPGLELKRRLDAYAAKVADGDEKAEHPLEEVDPEELVRLAATSARAVPRLYQAERLARGQSTTNVGGHRGGALETDDRRRQSAEERVASMNDEAIENVLLGAEAQKRREAIARAAEKKKAAQKRRQSSRRKAPKAKAKR